MHLLAKLARKSISLADGLRFLLRLSHCAEQAGELRRIAAPVATELGSRSSPIAK